VFEVLDDPAEITDAAHAAPLTSVVGAVTLRDVNFAYGDESVLRELSLAIAPGERVALVGPSGSGKTTIAALLSRFYEPQSGQILIDGQDIRTVTMTSLRQHVAMVDQEAALFNESIGNNILFGRPDADKEAVVWAAQQAYAHDFIMALPEQYDTRIGDRGLRISGGQRQRLCIARALLKNAPILILDEATSALDTESESMVQRALENLMQGRTTLVIAHRLSTIMGADRIVVLNQGRIQEIGTHKELLAVNGLYKRLYDMQFQNEGNDSAIAPPSGQDV
jgi:subfamily B ATP-binding cassette protein MsbA